MIINTEITLFDLKTTPSYIITGGGGGDLKYGKQNGIFVIEKNKFKNFNEKYFYKTNDFILKLHVYVENTKCEEYNSDEFCTKEYNSESEESISEINEINEIESDIKILDNNIFETIYILGIGENNFYFLKFQNKKFKLLIYENYKIKSAYLTNNLFLLINHRIYGFNNIISYPKKFKISLNKILLDKSEEEYLYDIYKKGNKLIYKREFGSDDISDDWDNFFIIYKKIHKVLYDENKSMFVFNNKKYIYSGKIQQIFTLKNDFLVFYITQDNFSYLYFLNSEEKIYKLPKITCINKNNNIVIVSTFEGTSIVYISGIFFTKTYISDLPITGISIEGNIAYFSLITGYILSKKIVKSKYYFGFFIAIIAILIGFFLSFYKK